MTPLNLWDPVDKRYLRVHPSLEHSLPEGDLLAFEVLNPGLKDFDEDRLSLTDFKVVQHAGVVVGVRTSLRAPRAIYLSAREMVGRIFGQFENVLVYPDELEEHPLIHVIPPGLPGAGGVVVRDVARLRSNGEDLAGLTFVEKEAQGRRLARAALVALGFTFKEAGP